jgi:hypothetical protein
MTYQPHGRRNVVAKTAAYTLSTGDFGTLFTTTGATQAIVFTLPSPTSASGEWAEFMNTVGQNMTVKTGAAGLMVTYNDATASSVAVSTANNLIGTGFRMVSDGTKWIAFTMQASGAAATAVGNAVDAAPITIA